MTRFAMFQFVRVAITAVILTVCADAQEQKPEIRVGIIGLDAHAVPWTQIIHDPAAKPPISAMRIVAAYPAFSPDIPFSKENIEQNKETMRKLGVEISGTIEELLLKVDAVMILSIDGRPHLEQARPVFAARKPVFIDKPVASSLAEIVQVFREAEQSGTPCFSNSALRYGPATGGIRNNAELGPVLGCDAYSNSVSILPEHPDLFYYGIHGCEALFTIMGPGCQTVRRVKTETADLVAGEWQDGRLGTLRGIRQGRVGFGATVFAERGIVTAGAFEGYEPLLAEIAQFFKSGKPPISVESTLEMYAFLEAADEKSARNGAAVTLQSVLEKAQQAASAGGN